MRYLITIYLCASISSTAWAGTLSLYQRATNLGNIIASEKLCNLTYDHTAITRWIDENVAPSEMGFSGTLSNVITITGYMLEDLSPSGRAAHCRSIANSAKHYGFIGK